MLPSGLCSVIPFGTSFSAAGGRRWRHSMDSFHQPHTGEGVRHEVRYQRSFGFIA
jgi:hypothetical protein